MTHLFVLYIDISEYMFYNYRYKKGCVVMSLSKVPPCGGNISTHSDDESRRVIIPIDNMAEYQELVELAQKQLDDLNETLLKLQCFSVTMKITF